MNHEKSEKYEVLKRYFGYDSFREGQEILIDGILDGRDVLGIMPTGSGKSLCYQVPALILPGITLVVSPLISLMKDQVTALNRDGLRGADVRALPAADARLRVQLRIGRPRGVSEQFADDGTVL